MRVTYTIEPGPSHTRIGIWLNGALTGYLTVRSIDEGPFVEHMTRFLDRFADPKTQLVKDGE